MKAPLIGLALSAVCFVLSVGLCGMQHNSTGGSLVAAGVCMLAVSVIGAAVSLIWLLIAVISGLKHK